MASQPVNPKSRTQRRIYMLGAFLFLWLCAICFRLVDLQIFRYGEWTRKAQRQQQRTIEVAAKRGIIYDRNGHELAMTVQVDSVFAVPSEVPDQESTAQILGKVLKADPQEILAHMKSSHAFSWVARKIDADTSNRIHALNLRGIYFQKESKRFYPKRELAAQVLGYVGTDDEGLGGIERGFEQRLQGRHGKMLISMDAKRRWYGRIEREPDPGENIVLTLDEKIQYIAERELDAAMAQTHAETGTIVVQNPRTGEVLALASRPTFNPNTFRNSDAKGLKNRAVSDVYEPGSTFKIVTIAAALEEKLTQPEEVIDCQMGAIYIGGVRIRDHHPFGLMTVEQILAHSSDVGTIKLGLRLGEEKFDRYIRAFGFGSQTGIDLPGETRGLAKPVSRWSKVSIGAISMGQEIGISPVQLVSMVSTIANDGVWTAPRIVAGTAGTGATVQRIVFHPAQQHRVISPLTAVQMKKMMTAVVLQGTGKRSVLNGYSSAGKTGTAQKIDPATGTYSKWKHVATFAGFAPVNTPAITVAVILDSPVGPHEGGQVSAPVFARVAQQVLEYLNVPHDTEIKNPQRLLLRAAVKDDELLEGTPDRIDGGAGGAGSADYLSGAGDVLAQSGPADDSATARGKTENLGSARVMPASYSALGDSSTAPPARAAQSAASARAPEIASSTGNQAGPPAPALKGTVVLNMESGPLVPSFLGQPMRNVLEAAQEAGVEVEIVGSGVARFQSPPAGTRLPVGGRVSIRFAR